MSGRVTCWMKFGGDPLDGSQLHFLGAKVGKRPLLLMFICVRRTYGKAI